MAEVLSQSQIDALLNAARSGELDVDKPAEKSSRFFFFYVCIAPVKIRPDRLSHRPCGSDIPSVIHKPEGQHEIQNLIRVFKAGFQNVLNLFQPVHECVPMDV